MHTSSNTFKHTQLPKAVPAQQLQLQKNKTKQKKAPQQPKKKTQSVKALQERNQELKVDLTLHNKQSRHANSDIIVLGAWSKKNKQH